MSIEAPQAAPEPSAADDGVATQFDAGAPPEPASTALDFSQLEQDVADVFGFGDEKPPQPAASPAQAEPGAATPDLAPAAAAPEALPPPAPAAPHPATAPAPTPPASPPAPVTAPAAPTPDELRSASLEAQIAALQSTVEQLRASPPAAATATPAAPGSDPAAALDTPVRYQLSLPEQVQQALASDDPAHTVQAVSWVANAVATIVHENLRKEFKPQLERLLNGMATDYSQSAAETAQAQTVEDAREQYYAKFPEHKNPLIGAIVAAESQKLATEYPGLTWGDPFMNSLGARVNAAIATLRGQPATPSAPTPPPKPAPSLPAAGPRPMVPSGESDENVVFETMRDGDFWS